jgi:hypothetical protein
MSWIHTLMYNKNKMMIVKMCNYDIALVLWICKLLYEVMSLLRLRLMKLLQLGRL